jgi:nucleoid-associated protein YgaU
MMDLVKTLKEENDNLKRELIAATNRVEQLERVLGQARRATQGQTGMGSANIPNRTQPRVERPVSSSSQPQRTEAPRPSDAPRTYTVQSGDTLSAISRQMYGTPSRWIDIYQANRDRLSSESALRVGQEIRIP